MRHTQRPVFAESDKRIQRKVLHTCACSGREDGSARVISRAAVGRASVSQRSFGVGTRRHKVSPPGLSLACLFCNRFFRIRFSLANLSMSPGSCCPKSLANTARYHGDALAASMTGQIIVPMCSSIDVFGFRIMCTGPVDNLKRRVLVGRDDPLADVLSVHGAAAAEGISCIFCQCD